jgi:hypothetical protein
MYLLFFLLLLFLVQVFVLFCCAAAGNDASSQALSDQEQMEFIAAWKEKSQKNEICTKKGKR